ncbi:hypothetical protein ACO0RG_001013 [Hanseniaspora osmophila]
MTQLSYQDLEALYGPLVSKYDGERNFVSFTAVGELPRDLKIKNKDTVWLAGGTPYESMFPVQEVDLKIRENPGSLDDTTPLSNKCSTTKVQMYEPQGSAKACLSTAFQYHDAKGLPELLNLTKQIISRMNKPQYENWDTVVTPGSSDSLSKICQTLLDSDSVILVEEFTYPNIVHWAKFAHSEVVQIKLNVTADRKLQGIDVEALRDLLANWVEYHPGKPKPKCMYTIATGHNPTGLTQSTESRQAIYEICCEHNIIIIEDDPYGYLNMTPYDQANPMKNPYIEERYGVEHYCKKILSPSYMSMDTEGRVLRCETFSKVAAPGLRLAFVAGNQFLISKLLKMHYFTTRGTSGASQAIVTNMLVDMGEQYQAQHPHEKAPLIDGWVNWCMKVAAEYTHRRNYMFMYMYEQNVFKKNLVSFIEPSCGMFVTLVINFKPEWNISETKRIMDYLYCCLTEEGCSAVLGYKMVVNRDYSMERANFLRFTFAKARDPNVFKIGAERINAAVERLFEEYNVNEQFTLGPKGII